MKENIIDLFQLLIELKNDNKVPEKYKRELERYISDLNSSIKSQEFKNNKSLIIKIVDFIVKLLNSS